MSFERPYSLECITHSNYSAKIRHCRVSPVQIITAYLVRMSRDKKSAAQTNLEQRSSFQSDSLDSACLEPAGLHPSENTPQVGKRRIQGRKVRPFSSVKITKQRKY